MPYAPPIYRALPKRDNRPSRSVRGYDNEWYRFRKWFLQENAFCAVCGFAPTRERLNELHVDHKQTVRQRPDLKYDVGNLQVLCSSCHSKKTVMIDGGFGR